jgi:DNA-binding response OmpR family regulator
MSSLDQDLPVVLDSSDPPDAPRDVALLRWPEDEALRRQLATARLPRLLLLAADQMPPIVGDELEDWLRFPLDPEDLGIRTSTLLARARQVVPRPFSVTLDEDDIAHADGRWVALAPLEARALARLLERPGAVVSRRTLIRACWPSRLPEDRRALNGIVGRLRRRVASLGLRIHTVPRSGYLLDYAPDLVGEDRPVVS